MTFAERLKQLRDRAGLSQSGLAAESGMSLGAIHDYEQGKREPSLRSAVKLAGALGVDCRAFADCEEGPPPKAKRPRGRPRKGE